MVIFRATQEDCKVVMRQCRDKIRKSKAQVELNLAITAKDYIYKKKNVFMNA